MDMTRPMDMPFRLALQNIYFDTSRREALHFTSSPTTMFSLLIWVYIFSGAHFGVAFYFGPYSFRALRKTEGCGRCLAVFPGTWCHRLIREPICMAGPTIQACSRIRSNGQHTDCIGEVSLLLHFWWYVLVSAGVLELSIQAIRRSRSC